VAGGGHDDVARVLEVPGHRIAPARRRYGIEVAGEHQRWNIRVYWFEIRFVNVPARPYLTRLQLPALEVQAEHRRCALAADVFRRQVCRVLAAEDGELHAEAHVVAAVFTGVGKCEQVLKVVLLRAGNQRRHQRCGER